MHHLGLSGRSSVGVASTSPRYALPSQPWHRPRSAIDRCSLSPTARGSLARTPHLPVVCSSWLRPKKPLLYYVGRAQAGGGQCAQKAPWLGMMLEPQPRPLPVPQITRSDEEFAASVGVEFVDSTNGIALEELGALFEKVGFPLRSPEKLQECLATTHRLVWVRACTHLQLQPQPRPCCNTAPVRPGQLLGFARATLSSSCNDGTLAATIWDVAVDPGWQRSGLGRAMMERLTKQLVVDGIPTITLYAEPNVVGLYERLGFTQKHPEGVKAMPLQRRGRGLMSGWALAAM